jgi:hypothetical protein
VTRFIDLTDAKFKTPINAAVMNYIRRANPSAHSDVGDNLMEIGKASPAHEPIVRTIGLMPMSCSTATPM